MSTTIAAILISSSLPLFYFKRRRLSYQLVTFNDVGKEVERNVRMVVNTTDVVTFREAITGLRQDGEARLCVCASELGTFGIFELFI